LNLLFLKIEPVKN